MTAQLQKQEIISLIDNAVQTSQRSKVFVKKVVPTIIEFIMHQRIKYAPSEFTPRKFNDLEYNVFKPTLKDENLKWIRTCIKDAINAFDKNCLRELFILFVSPRNENSVVEYYRFSFKKMEEIALSLESTPDRVSKLRMATHQLLESVAELGDSKFEPDEINMKFLLRFHDDKVPKNFSSKSYKADTDQHGITLLANANSVHKNQLGLLETGFHSVKIRLNNEMAVYASQDDDLSKEMDIDLTSE